MQTQTTETSVQQGDWTLDTEQMIFMLQQHNAIETAYAEEDMESLRALAASDEYKAVFGEMSFDEAYDRYEGMLKTERDES